MEANEHQLSISGQQMTALCSQHGEEVCQLQGELQQVKLQCRRVTEEVQRVAGAILGDKVIVVCMEGFIYLYMNICLCIIIFPLNCGSILCVL